jgi:hypothetical protein
MASNVDPQQARTATGARLMAYNQDVLVKDLNDMFIETSIKADAEMMFMLNRSEMSDNGYEIDIAKYERDYLGNPIKQQWVRVEPELFQLDGEITAEAGSTLADDDEGKQQQALTLWNLAMGRPDVFNIQTAAHNVLTAMGKRNDVEQWLAPPPQPQQPEFKGSASVSIKWPELSEMERVAVAKAAGFAPPMPQQMGAMGQPGSPPPAAMGGGSSPPPPTPQTNVAEQAFQAASGNSPMAA